MNVEDLSEGLVIPDVLTPAQFFADARGVRGAAVHPIKRLMLAVLEDALRCYQTYRGARFGLHRQLFAETELWLWDRRADGPFAVETICDALGINPECLRNALRKPQSHQLNGASVRRLARRSPVMRARGLSPKLPRGRRKTVAAGGNHLSRDNASSTG